ncbi:uncharacterized protein EDB93DRAFT_1256489 [Suillus bovinus]|uniref:uncharacterized protein n=1 Tax=Suillus bovinus TaxID=48563 RepID=UPI001B8866E7|nr:uncharacterized protein EDB93DRAFT_1256489 [Suillus bovinus]KAG2128939.1 hypothetical protein EDB93DRAFT_1256489 [Suillus bovinus]
MSETLSGGEEVSGRAPQEVEIYSQIFYNKCMKGEVDAAIEAKGITTCGQKLAKRKVLTRAIYAVEDGSVKAEVKARHQEAFAIWQKKHELAKAGFVHKVEQEEKIRAFSKLGVHLDRIFCHLSHKTGGLKFTCIAGGQDPTTGDIVVLDYHLRETGMGNEFPAQYTEFGKVWTAYADFVKLAITHDDKMLALVQDPNTAADEVANESEEIFGEGNEEDHDSEEKVAEEEGVMDNEVLGAWHNIELGLNGGLYQFNLTEDERSTIKSSPMGTGTTIKSSPTGAGTTTSTVPLIIPDNSIPLAFDQFNLSDFDTFFASLPPLEPYDQFTGPSCLQDLDFSFMHDSSDSFDYQSSPPITRELTDQILPVFSCDTAMPGSPPFSHSNHLPPTTPFSASTSGINIIDPNIPDPLTGVMAGLEGPCQTTRHYVPSTCEHILNAIGSSGAHMHPPVSIDKENNKRRKANSTGAGPQSRK